MNNSALTISQAAKACGLTPKTIRYYEQIGLIPKAARHNDVARTGGNRFYFDEDLRRLRFIRSSRLLGLGLNDVSALLALSEGKGCPGAQPGYRDRLALHLRTVNERMEHLAALKASLEELLRLAEHGSLAGRCGCTASHQPSAARIGLDRLGSSAGRSHRARKGAPA